MVLEDGPFRPASSPDRRAGAYGARIVITVVESGRLGLVEGGAARETAPCLAWCRDRFGRSGPRWFLSVTPSGEALIHFKLMVDALAFLGSWCLLGEELLAA